VSNEPGRATGSDREIALDLLSRALRCASSHPAQAVSELVALRKLLGERGPNLGWRDLLELVLFEGPSTAQRR